MYNIIKRFMDNLTKEQVTTFATSKDVNLSAEELDFVYIFIKKNWEQLIKNPKLLNLDRYQSNFSQDNFIKIKKLFNEYSAKYQAFLK